MTRAGQSHEIHTPKEQNSIETKKSKRVL